MELRKDLTRVGLFGGTFDPIHIGHLMVAQEAALKIGLQEVWFMPTGKPWLKEGVPVSSAEHRKTMADIATEENPLFKVSSMEINRPGPSYTVETLKQIKETGARGKPFFIIGMDSLESLHRWHNPSELFDLCSLVVVSRPAYLGLDLDFIEKIRPGSTKEITVLDGLRIGISGEEVRRRVAEKLPIKYWVPSKVEEYIYKNALYRGVNGE